MPILKATKEDIESAYRLLLGRKPDAEGLKHFSHLLLGDGISTIELAKSFMESPEFQEANATLLSPRAHLKTPPKSEMLLNCKPCTVAEIDSESFRFWAQQLNDLSGRPHRKLWEWCFITQALFERGALREGSVGLGFAVGQEPLTALYASMGCNIVATDLDHESADKDGWVTGNQHAAGLDQLNSRKICSPDVLMQNTSFRMVDMRKIPEDLRGYNFLWSSCAMEHLGSLTNGIDFVIESMRCLKPGGVAVHTTEFNCDSDSDTIETGHDVIYRKKDFMHMAEELRKVGHEVASMDFTLGQSSADLHVDEPPYKGIPHIRLRIGKFASTSFGIVVVAGNQ